MSGEPRRCATLPAAQPRCEPGGVVSARFADPYFSREDALGEVRHVFLQGNQMPEAWRHPAVCSGTRAWVIGELGFGTGLNFLAAWHLWRTAAPPEPARLEFLAVEGYPLSAEQLAEAHATLGLTELEPLVAELLAVWRPPLPGFHRMHFDGGRVALTLLHDEALRVLAAAEPPGCLDALFLDGFAPARNPEMWRPAVIAELARLSRAGGTTLATYTVAGEVRRTLNAAGFAVEKVPGHGPKRHMLRGHYAPDEAQAASDPPRGEPWARLEPVSANALYPAEGAQAAVVIGAGIAGCAAAHALTRRGFAVTVLERKRLQGSEAQAGGAAVAGLLMPRLELAWSAAMRFFLAANRFAWATLERLCREGHEIPHARSGSLLLATSATARTRYARIQAELGFPADYLEWLPAEQASARAGIALSAPALWLSEAGWLEPGALCRALAAAATLRDGVTVAQLSRDEATGRWRVFDDTGALLAEAPLVVLANAVEARRLSQAAWMPLRPVRGQTTSIPPTRQSAPLACPIAFGGYLTPAFAGYHHVGASYVSLKANEPVPAEPHLTAQEHIQNLAQLQAAIPDTFGELAAQGPDATTQVAALPGRAGVRATTPDHLPLVGPVVEREAFLERFAPLRHGKRLPAEVRLPVHRGLYALLGLGSRGLAAAPLAAELLAAQCCGEPWPLERDVAEALAPQRFLVRDMRRRKL